MSDCPKCGAARLPTRAEAIEEYECGSMNNSNGCAHAVLLGFSQSEVCSLRAELARLQQENTELKAEAAVKDAAIAGVIEPRLELVWSSEPPSEAGWYWIDKGESNYSVWHFAGPLQGWSNMIQRWCRIPTPAEPESEQDDE